MNTKTTATYTAVDYFGAFREDGPENYDFQSDRDNVNFTYVVWADGNVIIGKGFETFAIARGNMMGQLRKFDKKNIGASGQVREVIKK